MNLTRHYFLGGEATFTLDVAGDWLKEHKQAATHYTFRIKKMPARDKMPEAYLAYVLAGPDNQTHYRYMGKVNPNTGEITRTSGSNVDEHSYELRFLRRVLFRIFAGQGDVIEKAGFRVMHDGTCSACGKPLTRPDSIDLGLGPVCAKRAAKKDAAQTAKV